MRSGRVGKSTAHRRRAGWLAATAWCGEGEYGSGALPTDEQEETAEVAGAPKLAFKTATLPAVQDALSGQPAPP